MSDGLRRAFIDYCKFGDRPSTSHADTRAGLAQQLNIVSMQLSRCHSAHECAKQFPDIGPVLATLAQSRTVAGSSELCQAVVSTAMEYSKAVCQTVYANHKASVWFSQIVRSLLDSASEADTHHTFTLLRREVVCDELAAQMLCVQRLAKLAGVPDTGNSGSAKRRERMWKDAFSVCSGDGVCEMTGSIISSLDECGWAQLGRHEIIERHGVRLLESLPIDQALVMWQRVDRVRALLVVHLLRERETTAGATRIVRAVLADGVLSRQVELDMARLIQATRDWRIVELWKRLCRSNADAIRARSQIGGSQGIEELFGGPGAFRTGVLEQQWACVADARRQTSALSTWVRIIAVASDDYVTQLLLVHFGMAGAAGLTRQQVAEREMALEVAAFVQAPLASADVAKSWVLATMTREKTSASASKPAKAAAKPKAPSGGVKKTVSKKVVGGKKLSAYNVFMKTELAKVKTDSPGMNHKDAFKKAASNWKNAPENPINAKA
ncbi:hypothetical protein GGI20_000190 [Coemansia sp. BCRC 34301]|nr:hypothetical protein GGI20_000190 [Coemansia sp. BCRC 34301]